MYLHNQDWEAAMRVAEQSDPTAVMDILAAQVRFIWIVSKQRGSCVDDPSLVTLRTIAILA
jgi:hypothetical protein